MTGTRSVAAGLVVLALVTGLLVLLDVAGPVRGALSLSFLLLGPGLALSLPMSPMAPAARALVAVTGSVAATTLVSLLLMLLGVWSGETGALVLVAIVVVLAIAELRRSRLDAVPTAEPTADADGWTYPAIDPEMISFPHSDVTRRAR